jgi:hypothetical protein
MSAAWMNFTKIPLFHDDRGPAIAVRCRQPGHQSQSW